MILSKATENPASQFKTVTSEEKRQRCFVLVCGCVRVCVCVGGYYLSLHNCHDAIPIFQTEKTLALSYQKGDIVSINRKARAGVGSSK